MRARNLKPGFFKNEDLAQLPFEGRLMFEGLWCMADREGKLEDRPKRLKAELFPYDSVDTESMLRGLADVGLIVRYEVDGTHYILIPTFLKHQKPHRNEASSVIPDPPGFAPQAVPRQPLGTKSDVPRTEALATKDNSAPAESLLSESLLSESLSPIAPHGAECVLLGEKRFDHWRSVFPEETAQLSYTPDTRRAVEARLREGIPPGLIDQAVDNAKVLPWWNGQDDGIWKAHLKKICNKGSTVEALAAAKVIHPNGHDECPVITAERTQALMEMNP